MGSDKNEKPPKIPRRKTPAKSAARNKIANYHPTEADLVELRSGKYGTLEALDDVCDRAETADCKVSIAYNSASDGWYAMIRTNEANWDDALALSAWHAVPNKAVTLLGWALTHQYANWPDEYQTQMFAEADF
jgi:hypothetical protein